MKIALAAALTAATLSSPLHADEDNTNAPYDSVFDCVIGELQDQLEIFESTVKKADTANARFSISAHWDAEAKDRLVKTCENITGKEREGLIAGLTEISSPSGKVRFTFD